MLATAVYFQVLLAGLGARARRWEAPQPQRRRDPRAGERAQGTVEYVALVTLVAIVMVGVIAAVKSARLTEGQELGSLVLKKIAEAVSKVKY